MKRVRKIDLLKGILVLQMVLGHCFQFFGDIENVRWTANVVTYVNLMTFSGFLFCFGYVANLVYLQQDFKRAVPKILKNVLRCLLAFYLSSFFYMIFVDGMALRADKVLDILLFRHLAGWSEFLLSFVLVMLMQIPLHLILRKIPDWAVALLMGISILATFLPKQDIYPLFASVIDGRNGAFFPILQYSLYFYWGYLAAGHQKTPSRLLGLLPLAGTVYYLVSYVRTGVEPSRFPLSAAYLIGGAGLVYLWYCLASLLEEKEWKILRQVETVGKNSLWYLLLSNAVIFAVSSTRFYRRSPWYALGLYVAIFLILPYVKSIYREEKHAIITSDCT